MDFATVPTATSLPPVEVLEARKARNADGVAVWRQGWAKKRGIWLSHYKRDASSGTVGQKK